MEIDKDQFNEWLGSPVTKAVLKYYEQEQIEIGKKMSCGEGIVPDNSDMTLHNSALMVGTCNGLGIALNVDVENLR